MASSADKSQDFGDLSPDVLAAAFDLAPAAAIAFFEKLGVTIAWDWRRDMADARTYAFAISKVTDLQLLQAVRNEVLRALQTGISQTQFRRYLTGRLASLGWLGERAQVQPDGSIAAVDLSTAYRQNVIFRTNMQTAYMAGRYQAQVANADNQPVWQYVAVLDERTRKTHRAMNGRAYMWNDPVWRKIYPPCGFNCRCRVRAMSLEDAQARGVLILQGAVAPLPKDFPDAGFDNNPGLPNGMEAGLQISAARARSALNAPPPVHVGHGQ